MANSFERIYAVVKKIPRGMMDATVVLPTPDGIEFTEDGRVDMVKYGWTGLG